MNLIFERSLIININEYWLNSNVVIVIVIVINK